MPQDTAARAALDQALTQLGLTIQKRAVSSLHSGNLNVAAEQARRAHLILKPLGQEHTDVSAINALLEPGDLQAR